MKTSTLKIILLLLATVILAACKPSYFIAGDFAAKTQKHKKVAVIPVEMIFTGTKPKKLSEAQIDSIEVEESKMFQISLFNNFLKYSNTRKGTVNIEFQSFDKTNKVLEDNGIKIRDAWSADPTTLAKILDVDAVVKTRVVKQRYMSDLASYGIQTAANLLSSTQLGGIGGLYPIRQVTHNGKTNDIDAQC
ncbi:MAG: hypothetical protein IAF38_04440, partial [Bacteroidia bacterium]|nr:hypothetical protein [Bacteroidia bacterium]